MTDSIRYHYGNLPDQVQVPKKYEFNTNGQIRTTEYTYAHEVDDHNKKLNNSRSISVVLLIKNEGGVVLKIFNTSNIHVLILSCLKKRSMRRNYDKQLAY